MPRLIRIDVVDFKERPLAGATIALSLDGEAAGSITSGLHGRAIFDIHTDGAVIEATVTFGRESKHQRLVDEQWTCQLVGVHLVILVHGINTRAHWLGPIQDTLEDAGFKVAPAGYGRLSVPLFLLPMDWARARAVTIVKRKIDAAVEINDPACVSVISHSFGTYIIARILATAFNFRFHRIVFCGSVVSGSFPFDQFLTRFSPPILNEIGTRDFWPAIAESVTWGYGSVGSHGYQGAPLKERWHSDFAHSDFLTPAFCTRFWIPFLRDGTTIRADYPAPLPWWISLIASLRIKYWIVGLAIGLVIYEGLLRL